MDLVVLVVLVPPQPTTVATQKATTKTARIRFIEVLLGQGGRNRETARGNLGLWVHLKVDFEGSSAPFLPFREAMLASLSKQASSCPEFLRDKYDLRRVAGPEYRPPIPPTLR